MFNLSNVQLIKCSTYQMFNLSLGARRFFSEFYVSALSCTRKNRGNLNFIFCEKQISIGRMV